MHKQAVTGFLGQTYSEGSLAAFYKLLCNGTMPCGQDKDATKVVCKRRQVCWRWGDGEHARY